jgi:hypothetical protein
MSVPKLGTYISSDNNYKIQINSANPSNGQITGAYEAKSSPEGSFIDQGATGGYAWVTNQQGQSGVAPFNIRMIGSVRPSGFPYCIVDTWNGAYQTDNSLLMQGSRAYVNSKGVIQVTNLGNLRFAQ